MIIYSLEGMSYRHPYDGELQPKAVLKKYDGDRLVIGFSRDTYDREGGFWIDSGYDVETGVWLNLHIFISRDEVQPSNIIVWKVAKALMDESVKGSEFFKDLKDLRYKGLRHNDLGGWLFVLDNDESVPNKDLEPEEYERWFAANHNSILDILDPVW